MKHTITYTYTEPELSGPLVVDLSHHVNAARLKHPLFPKSRTGKALVLLEEVGEVLWAAAFQGPHRVREELMDVAAVIVRWYEGD